jgi:hypothetical protein
MVVGVEVYGGGNMEYRECLRQAIGDMLLEGIIVPKEAEWLFEEKLAEDGVRQRAEIDKWVSEKIAGKKEKRGIGSDNAIS